MDGKADDMFNWRKYGQKNILGTGVPRSYFKCAVLGCPAKKQACSPLAHHRHLTAIMQVFSARLYGGARRRCAAVRLWSTLCMHFGSGAVCRCTARKFIRLRRRVATVPAAYGSLSRDRRVC